MTPPARPPSIDRSPAARFRHDLLTPVNHIVGYASLLLDAAQDSGKTDRWPTLHILVEQGRRVQDTIEEWLPSDPATQDRPDYSAMADQLATVAGLILEGCDSLEQAAALDDTDRAEFLADLSGIRVATLRLVDMARTGPTDPPQAA